MAVGFVAENMIFSVERLNEKAPCGVTFSVSDSADGVAEILEKKFPYGKVALFAYNETFFSAGMKLVSALKKRAMKPISFLFDKTVFSVSGVSGAFCLPEDVRAVIAVDGELYPFADYFASVRGIDCVYYEREFIRSGFLRGYRYIRNGADTEKVGVTAKRLIIFDKSAICGEAFAVKTFAGLVGRLAVLADYKLQCAALGKKPDKKNYDGAKRAIIDVSGVLKEKFEEDSVTLFEKALSAEICIEKLFSDCGLSISAAENVKFLLTGDFLGNGETEAIASDAMLKLFKDAFAKKLRVDDCAPDYNDRAKEYAASSAVSLSSVLKELKAQTEALGCVKKNLYGYKTELYAEIKALNRLSERMTEELRPFMRRSEKSEFAINRAVDISGDGPFGINGASVIREFSYLE